MKTIAFLVGGMALGTAVMCWSGGNSLFGPTAFAGESEPVSQYASGAQASGTFYLGIPSSMTLPAFDRAIVTGRPVEELDASSCGPFENGNFMFLRKGSAPESMDALLLIGTSPGTRLSSAILVAPETCTVDGVIYDIYEGTVD